MTIHNAGGKFNVIGSGADSQHDDIESALRKARSVFGGGESGSDDTAMAAGGVGAAI